jgi:hypothetical protein
MQPFRFAPVLAGVAFFCLDAASYGGPEPIVDIPTADKNVVLAGQHKSAKEVMMQEETAPWWSITIESGYSSKYIFRGTDLTPNSDGIVFSEVKASAWGFTLGAWVASQIDEAIVPFATAVGEAGGGTLTPGGVFLGKDTAIQSRFSEVDLYLQYAHSFGWIDVAVGNIAFLIFREQRDEFQFYDFCFEGDPPTPPVPTNDFDTFRSIGNEQFDRLFISVSTSKIPYLVPRVTYYQTIYNEGDEGDGPGILGFTRNDKLGGYLEGKLSSTIPLIHDLLTLQPTALVSYSFDDRSKSISFTDPAAPCISKVVEIPPTAVPLTGFNHFQTGSELVLQISQNFKVVGFGNYAYHFAAPTAGTDKNEYWGGAKLVFLFP